MATAVSYVIYLTDATKLAALQAQYPTGIQIPPSAAAAAYGVPGPKIGTNNLNATGGVAVFQGDSVGYGVDLSGSFGTQTFDIVFTNQRPPGASFPQPYPVTLNCFWVGYFLGTGSPGTQAPTTPRYLGARNWCVGFEIPTLGEGGAALGIGMRHLSRDGSRTADGLGLTYRNNSTTAALTMTLPAATRVSWERFYVRLRVLPVGGDDNIWSAKGSIDGGEAALINVNTTGTLQFYGQGNAAYPGASIGLTSALTRNTWYRVDFRIEFPTAGTGILMRAYLNGVLQFDARAGNNTTNQVHSTSRLGETALSVDRGTECDLDDWVSAAEVLNDDSNGALTRDSDGKYHHPGHDLTSGSHVQLVRPTGFGADHQTAAWTGTYRNVNNLPADGAGATTGLVTTTPSAKLHLTTDFSSLPSPSQNGVASIAMGVFPFVSSGAGAGSIKVSAAPLVSTAFANVTWATSPNIYTIVSGATADSLPDISPLTLTVVSPSNAGTTTFVGVFAAAEHIGYFGPEDYVSAITFPPRLGIHNAPYPEVAASKALLAPIQAVRVASGIYTGNDIGQDVFAAITPHWYWVRPLTVSTDGVVWWSSMVSAHRQMEGRNKPEGMTQAKFNAGDPRLLVGGKNNDADAATLQYQWIAVSDLAMRHLINGAFRHKGVASIANTLVDSAFTPEAVFFYVEDVVDPADKHYYRGIGHAADNASLLNAAETAGVATMAAGSITSKTPLHGGSSEQTAYSAWRRDAACAWFDLVTYTGNGASPRNIAVALGGGSPLFALVVPHDSGSIFRDASHTGITSSPIGGALTNNGIRGGDVNQITVGTALNANGIVYDVFVIRGGAVAGGWSTNAAFTACVEAARPTVGPWLTSPAAVAITPVVLSVPPQWRVHRVDLKPRQEEHA